MFELDNKPFQAQLDAARGALQSQQARFATAQANLARVKPLAAQNASRSPTWTRLRASSTQPRLRSIRPRRR